MRDFTEQELVRRGKLDKFKELGIDPFGHRFDRTMYSNEVKEKYSDLSHDELEEQNNIEIVVGRIMFIRKMGKASFFSIKD